jgi:glycosyltransferase involved in cell wall biosynthesis
VRIAVVSPDPADNSGGVERFCHTLREALSSRGADVEVVDAERLRRLRHDLVVTNGMLGGRTPAPRIHVYHGCWVDHVRLGYRHDASLPWRMRFLAGGAAREVRAGRGAYRVAVSDSTAAEVGRWYRYRIHRVIPHAVDTDTFTPVDRAGARRWLGLAAEERLALFVGRAEARKRPALAAGLAAQTGYRLLFAGAGSLPGADGLGVLAPRRLAAWVQAVDVVLSTSAYEGSGLAILEALAAGTPVVATRTGCVPTLLRHIPEYRELTAPVDDRAGLAAALNSLPRCGEAVVKASWYVRREHGMARFTDDWATAVDDAVRGRRDAGPGLR